MTKLAPTIFNECKKVLFNKKEYPKIALKYNINLKKLNSLLINYIASKYQDLSTTSFKNYYLAFLNFATGLNTPKANKQALYYFNNLATKEEKINFNSKIKTILNQINTFDNLKELINYLNSISLSFTEITYYIKNSYLNNLNFYKSFYNLFEPWFLFAKENLWDSKILQLEAKKWHVTTQDYRNCALNYGKYILNLNFNITQITLKNKYTPIINALINTSNEKEIIALIKDNQLRWSTIQDYLNSKMCYLTKLEKNQLEKELLHKYKLYLQSKKTSSEEINIDYLFIDFIESGKTLEEYATYKHLERAYLSNLIRNIKDKELQTKVKKTIKQQNLNKCKLNNINFNNQKALLLSYLENGILDDGKLRKFDIIDFYTIFSDEHFLNKITLNWEKDHLYYFVIQISNDQKITLNSLLTLHIERDCLKDKDGKSIYGTGKVLSKDEILFIASYLKDLNIPLTTLTFSAGVNRYLNGKIIKDSLQL